MSVTREQLYEELWSEPALKVAARHGVSSSYLVRVCEALRVPRPPRGYWARVEHGYRPKRVPLPLAQPGDETFWSKGDPLPLVGSRRPKAAPAATGTPPGERRHALVAGVAELFEVGWVTDAGYLRTRKQNIVDVFTSKATLTRALDVANELFRLLERRGHNVTLDAGRYGGRPQVDHREKGKGELPYWSRETWSPGRLTVVYFDQVAFGLTLYELSESVEVRYVDGKYVRLTELPVRKRPSWREPHSWTTHKDLPTGRLALRAYSPSVKWQREWREGKAGELPRKFQTVIRELAEAVPELEQLIEQQNQERERRHLEWEEQQRRERKEAAERKRQEAFKAGREQLLAIVEKWALAGNIEEFFANVERRAEELTEEERQQVKARLESARRMLGGTDALRRFADWVSPRERLRADGVDDDVD